MKRTFVFVCLLCSFAFLAAQSVGDLLMVDLNDGSVVRIDPITGIMDNEVTNNLPLSHIRGQTTIDYQNNIFYVMAEFTPNGDPHLLAYDLTNDQFLGATQLQLPSSHDYPQDLFWDPVTSNLYCFSRSFSAPQLYAGYYLMQITPSTGGIDFVSPDPVLGFLTLSIGFSNIAFNPNAGEFYLRGLYRNSAGGHNVTYDIGWTVVDKNTGTVKNFYPWTLPNGASYQTIAGSVTGLGYNALDNHVYGILTHPGNGMAKFDLTGDTLAIGDSCYYQVIDYRSSISPSRELLTFINSEPQSFSGGHQLGARYTLNSVDLQTGTLVATTQIPSPSTSHLDFGGICYYENCVPGGTLTADVLCAGAPSTFGYSGYASNIQWDFGDPSSTTDTSSSPTPSYTYLEAGAYTATAIVTGCTGTDTLTIPVDVPAQPLFTLGPDTTFCPGDTLLIGVPDLSLNLTWNTGATTPLILVTQPGIYTATLNAGTACAVTDDIMVTVPLSCPPAVITPDSGMSVFPNPSNHCFNLEIWDMAPMEMQMELYDWEGRKVMLRSMEYIGGGMSMEVPTADLPAGMYFLRVHGEEMMETRKIWIRH